MGDGYIASYDDMIDNEPKLTVPQERRRAFVKEIGELVELDELSEAEHLIRHQAAGLGTRKKDWLESIRMFEKNRVDWPDSQRWAILQWTVAANYAIK